MATTLLPTVATQVLSTNGSGGFRWPCGCYPRWRHPRGWTPRTRLQVELNGRASGLQLEDVQVDVQKIAHGPTSRCDFAL